MADLATLSIKVDASGAGAALDQFGKKLGQTEKQAITLTSVMGRLGIVLSAGMIFKKFIDETSEAQFALAQLEARVKSTGGAAGQSVAQLQAYASELQNLTTFSDDAVMGAQAMLLTFDKIRNETFPAATLAVANLAAAMGTDLRGASIQVGKALQDPAQGLTALRRSGVSFSAVQQLLIEDLFNVGKEAEAQALILAELDHQFANSAEAARKTLGGALLGLKNAFSELFEFTKGETSAVVLAIDGMARALLRTRDVIQDILAISSFGGFKTSAERKVDAAAELATASKAADAAAKAVEATKKATAAAEAAALALLSERRAVEKLAQSYEDKANSTRREIDYVTTHRDKVVALTVAQYELKTILDKLDEDAARRIAGSDRLAGLGTGAGVFPIATGFQGGPTPKVSNALGQAAIMEAHAIGEATGRANGEAYNEARLKKDAELKVIQDNFVKQFQQTLSTGIANILENGLSSWRSFFASVKSMFLKLVADMASARVMAALGVMGEGNKAGGLATAGLAGAAVGYAVGGMTRNTTTGALAGGAAGAATGAAMGSLLGPGGAAIGGLVGGLAGLVTGFMGASAAAKKYATEMVQQQNTLMAAAQAFVDRGLTGQAKIQSEQNKLAKERDDLLKALEANFKAGGFGTGGAANYQRTVEEIGFAYDRQRKALEDTTKAVEQQIVAQEAAAVAAEAFNASLTAMDLDARRLAATGRDEQSAATSLFTRQAREYAQAVADGWTVAQLINLQEVQALEALSAAAKKASTDVIYSANSLALLGEQVVEVSAAWQKTIDYYDQARNAAEQTANAIRSTVQSTRSLFESLSGYMTSLLVGSLSPLTKEEQASEARRQFEEAARKAAFGDLAAGGNVTGLANTFLQTMKDIGGTETPAYRQAFEDVRAMVDAATLGVGGQLDIQVQQLRQAELQTSILTRMLAQSNASARGVPFFAHGGDHGGGMAIVGERGPELINTGRARIFSAADSAAAFAGNSTATVEELRRVIARLETLVRVTAAGAQETVKAVARVSNDVASLTREVRLSGEAAA